MLRQCYGNVTEPACLGLGAGKYPGDFGVEVEKWEEKVKFLAED